MLNYSIAPLVKSRYRLSLVVYANPALMSRLHNCKKKERSLTPRYVESKRDAKVLNRVGLEPTLLSKLAGSLTSEEVNCT